MIWNKEMECADRETMRALQLEKLKKTVKHGYDNVPHYKEAFDKATNNALATIGDYFRCAYRSLAVSYRQAIEELEANTGCTYERLYIVGGGAKNGFLNRLTEETTGKQVVALPIEATALGNLKIQMEVE